MQSVRAMIGPKLLKSFNGLAAQPWADTMKYTLDHTFNKLFSNHVLYSQYKQLLAKEKYRRFVLLWCHTFCYMHIYFVTPTNFKFLPNLCTDMAQFKLENKLKLK